jgi:hypothetical protein
MNIKMKIPAVIRAPRLAGDSIPSMASTIQSQQMKNSSKRNKSLNVHRFLTSSNSIIVRYGQTPDKEHAKYIIDYRIGSS